jgi:hypothetical protein
MDYREIEWDGKEYEQNAMGQILDRNALISPPLLDRGSRKASDCQNRTFIIVLSVSNQVPASISEYARVSYVDE